MYTFKTHNNIAKEGTDVLIENNFAINEVEPDALLIRSFILEDKNFNKWKNEFKRYNKFIKK